MKKLLYSFLILVAFSISTYASDYSSDVMATFDKYVNDSNAYSKNIPDYYTKDAKILRVVNRKQGGQKTVQIPFDRYLKELSGHAALAKAVRYKNRYENRKVTKIDENNYKISAKRIPRNDKVGLASHFIFTKTSSGWKIKEESMTTNRQEFLNAK